MAIRLQAALVWPSSSTSVTGWAMDTPVERVRVLGVSPESDEAGLRSVMGRYGEGLISLKKLPGCTNGL